MATVVQPGSTTAIIAPPPAGDTTVPPDANAQEGADDDASDRDYEDVYEYMNEVVIEERIDPSITFDEFRELFYDEYIYTFNVNDQNFEEYWLSRAWEEDDAVHDHFETFYAPGRKPSRYETGLNVDYDRCTVKELMRFTDDRGLKHLCPKGLTFKYYYIRALEAADKRCKFELMALPPEMRLSIYRYLLILPGGEPEVNNCYTAVLQTCRQIHQEARGVLYDENVIECNFDVKGLVSPALATDRYARVHNTVHAGNACPAMFYRFPYGINDYPDFLRRITHLKITCTYVHEAASSPQEGREIFNRVLCMLASFLMDGHSLKKLDLEFDFSEHAQAPEIGRLLYPLRRVRNIGTVNISGQLPPNIQKKLVDDMQSNEPAFNTLMHRMLLVKEAYAQIDLLETLLGLPECDCGECFEQPDCVLDIQGLSDEVENAEWSCFLDSQNEERFLALLSVLRTQVMAFSTSHLMKRVTAVIKKRDEVLLRRTEVERYEGVSDEGRLKEAEDIWDESIFEGSVVVDHDEDWGDDELLKNDPENETFGKRTAADDLPRDDDVDQLVQEAITGCVRAPSPEL